MRKIGISLFFLFCTSVLVFGQQDVSTAGPKGISEAVKKRINKSKDRLVLEFCMMNAFIKKDGGITVPDDFKLENFNRGFNAYFYYDLILGKKTKFQHFSLAPGIGVGSENYYFKKFGMSWIGDTATRFYAFGDSIASRKSKLNMTYIDIPFEFRYRSKPHKKTGMAIKVSVGFKFGFLVGSKWKYEGEELNNSGNNVKFKQMGVANMNKLRYGPYIRAGYGLFNLFCYYSLSNTFVNNKGPKMNPIVFGLSINGL